jgi:eukaryotic-like serine/threonine-protein kinase
MSNITSGNFYSNIQPSLPTEIIHEKYQILSLLGEGGTGKTYRCLDRKQQIEVVVKILNLHNIKDWKNIELFEREAKVLARIEHPAIPKYLDFFRANIMNEEVFCLVQEIAPGLTLNSLIESGYIFNEMEVRKIAQQILGILIYLQTFTPPIIHRDIKPQNLLYTDSGQIHLIDFGAVRDTYHFTVTGGGTIVGTYGYMAPEQTWGQAMLATDLYGLGTTLLYLLSGRDPGDLPVQRMKIDFRSQLQVSADFASWLDGLLAPIPEERYRNASIALKYLHGKAPIKPPSPAKTISSISQNEDRFIIVIPCILLESKSSKKALASVVLMCLLVACSFWLLSATITPYWGLILLLLLVLPFQIIYMTWKYLRGILSDHEILIDYKNSLCTIDKYVMPINQLAVIDRGKKGIQIQCLRQSLKNPQRYVRHTYTFGQYLDRLEQQWLLAEISEQFRLLDDEKL